MKLAVMQPYFLPYLGYFQLVAAADKFVIYDDVNFIKGGWINRNRILLNGREHRITVPLAGASPNRLINQIELVTGRNWRRKLANTIEQAYRPALHFKQVMPLIDEIVNYPTRKLSEYLLHGLKTVRAYLDIDTTLVSTSGVYNNATLKGEGRILDICRQEKATVYINASGGRQLYNPEHFCRNNVALRFLEPSSVEYRQFSSEFYPALSIVDVLMFNSREEVKAFLPQTKLQS